MQGFYSKRSIKVLYSSNDKVTSKSIYHIESLIDNTLYTYSESIRLEKGKEYYAYVIYSDIVDGYYIIPSSYAIFEVNPDWTVEPAYKKQMALGGLIAQIIETRDKGQDVSNSVIESLVNAYPHRGIDPMLGGGSKRITIKTTSNDLLIDYYPFDSTTKKASFTYYGGYYYIDEKYYTNID